MGVVFYSPKMWQGHGRQGTGRPNQKCMATSWCRIAMRAPSVPGTVLWIIWRSWSSVRSLSGISCICRGTVAVEDKALYTWRKSQLRKVAKSATVRAQVGRVSRILIACCNCRRWMVAAPRRGICAVSAEQEVASPTFIREHCTAEGSMSPQAIREVCWEARAPKAGVVATERLAAMRQQHSERRSITIGIVCGCGHVKSTCSVSHWDCVCCSCSSIQGFFIKCRHSSLRGGECFMPVLEKTTFRIEDSCRQRIRRWVSMCSVGRAWPAGRTMTSCKGNRI